MEGTPPNPTPEPAPLVRLTAGQVRQARQRRQGYPPARASQPDSAYAAAAAGTPAQTGRGRRSRLRVALGLVSFALIAGLLVYLIPIVLAARNAYDKIFVTPAPRPTVVINPQGTPELVLPTPGSEEAPIQLPDWEKKDRINILLLGVDKRESEDVPRSDTMIIVMIDPLTRDVAMLSIPRDLLVTIPGYGDTKINAAYSYGAQSDVTGPGLVRATIEYNFGIPIHYFAEVDFEGFVRIVDTLGGVTVDVPAPIKDDEYPGEQFDYTRIYFPTGLQHMDGRTALRYVRTRHDDNDFARGARQQQVLQALREQGIRLNLIARADKLLAELGDAVRTDLSPTEVLALAKLGTEIDSGRIRTYSLLNATYSYWEPGQPYYLIPDWGAIQQVLNEMMPPREGQPVPQVRGSAVQVPEQAPEFEPTVPPDEPPPTPEVIPTPAVEEPTPTEEVVPTPTEPLTTPTAEPTEESSAPSSNPAILVQNGTFTDGLAAQAAATLQASGFTNVTYAQAPDAGNYPTSLVIDYSGNPNLAVQVAAALGLPPSAAIAGDPAASGGYDIIVILGEDVAASP
ncbi:LCP family protein [Thermomicrobiaceae bacterium CFH 74404]|uniref:LCP family protein n=1 Tax=Thermalbibacter longus TaxID=2951981 RepID=A0AA41WA06_9BACT|nr:LCP family protein [Thermalbibacter longus]MCM8748197.1 LCP family protein [Thermalbibacter longus]